MGKMSPINSLLILANTLPLLIVMNHVGYAICVVYLDLQVLLNAQLFVLVEYKDVQMLLSLPVLLLQKLYQFLKRSLPNLPLNLAITFLNLTARKLVDFAGFVMFLALTKLGLNAQLIVSMVSMHVPKLVMLAKQDVWNSFHQFLIYQLQLMLVH